MNAQLEQEVQDKYCQLWLSHKQALIGKYFQKENLAGKGAGVCLYELLVCKYGNLDTHGSGQVTSTTGHSGLEH